MKIPKDGKFVGNSIGDLAFICSDDILFRADSNYLAVNNSKPKRTKNVIVLGMRKVKRRKGKDGE